MNTDDRHSEGDLEQVAVIGVAGRFPGAASIEAFWANLCAGVDSIVRHSEVGLQGSGVPAEWLDQPGFVKAGTCLDHFDEFDPGFFGCTPREALLMDPQQRLFLETCWHALEDAGYSPETGRGGIGLFAGTSPNRYRSLFFVDPEPQDVAGQMEQLIGGEPDFLTTRVSYKLDLKGPSLTVQTACSSSLVAVQLACQSLLTYQCDMAIAGGTTVSPGRQWGYFHQPGAILSPDGYCRAFDAHADGTVPGQAVGAVVLKRLSEAVSDRDHIYAVIKGCAINNDGAIKVGYTAPSIKGQADVIALAHALSGITADSITYVEAHGTGTRLGDPVEIAALTRAFRASTDRKGFCAVGSVKTNIGHADAAAGIAGLIKTALMLRHRKVPPSLHFTSPNPEIDFSDSPFYVQTRLSDWTSPQPRRAGVSSLGIGGTNVHAILEEPPPRCARAAERSHQLLVLSARTPGALQTLTRELGRWVEGHPDESSADVAFTLAVGRRPFPFRRAVVARSDGSARAALERLLSDPRPVADVTSSTRPAVVFMFTGQGSQYIDMGRELYASEHVFREAVERCCNILTPLLSVEFDRILYPPDHLGREEVTCRLNQTAMAQPALFTIEYALAMLWQSWGIRPAAMVGHSIGEYVAACLAGVFSLDTALSIVADRGRVMQSLPPGAMLAVAASEAEVNPWMNERLDVAAVNAPSMCVVSGAADAVDELERQLRLRQIESKRLITSHAFHSRAIEPVMSELASFIASQRLNPPSIPYLSNLTGRWITPEEATDPRYWVEHARRPVRFSECVRELLTVTPRILLEVGPGRTLCSLVKQHTPAADVQVLRSMRAPGEQHADLEIALASLGSLWAAGCTPDWEAFYRDQGCGRVSLPGYPFERRRFWPESGVAPRILTERAEDRAHPLTAGPPSVPARVQEPSGSVSPDRVTSRLKEIWCKLIGASSVGLHDDFFDLGGSSLLAVRLFAEIERQFQLRLPLSVLLEAPTIASLADVIARGDTPRAWSSLVPLREGGAKPPFFCVHAAGGNVLMYRDLAKYVGPDQPFYGLQSRYLNGAGPQGISIEEMADQYLEEIRRLQPHGPYLLGGYCMGGTIAFEIAQRLYAMGQDVRLLALFETYRWNRVHADSYLAKTRFYLEKVEFHVRNLMLADDAIAFFREKVEVARSRKCIWHETVRRHLSGMNGRGASSQPVDGNGTALYRLWQANDAAAVRYNAQLYPGRLTLFRAHRQYSALDTAEAGWHGVAAGGVDVRRMHVYPAGMLVEPFVRQTAVELQRCIEAAI